jgi:hypothetical protein
MRWIVFAAAAAALAQLPDLKVQRTPPEQPIPFNHKLHVANGLQCKGCHPIPEPGDFATIPKPGFCMGCHASIKKDSPHIARLAAASQSGERIRWAPVYRIADWVSFSHKSHTSIEGVTCESCHGPVATREVLRREKDISMAGCMECHRTYKASNDCLLCHDQR